MYFTSSNGRPLTPFTFTTQPIFSGAIEKSRPGRQSRLAYLYSYRIDPTFRKDTLRQLKKSGIPIQSWREQRVNK